MIGAHDRVKVLDFGIARFLERAQAEAGTSTSSGLTALGDFIGTPAYAAPEQIQGFQVDARADLYTTGVMLFEVAAGRRPFLSTTAQGYIDQHLGSPPPALWAAKPDLPHVKALDAIVQKALAKDPEERWQSAPEMREALLAVVGPLIPVEHAPTRRYDRPPASASGVMTAAPGAPASPISAAHPSAPGARGPAGTGARPAPSGPPTLSEVRTRPCALLCCEGVAGLTKLFVVGGERLAIGRSREDPKRGVRNDAIVRALPCRDQQKDPENWAATVQVSHSHAEIAVDGARATAVDRSSRGTILDGAPLPKEKAVPLPDAFALDIATPLLRLEGRIARAPAASSSLDDATDLGEATADGPIEAIVLRRAANVRDHAYALAPRSLALGRAPLAPLDLDAPGVAPLHARLTFAQGALCVEALGDSLTIDGARLEPGAPVPLFPGARVALGTATLAYKEAEDADFTTI
jgi:hypothetical protein